MKTINLIGIAAIAAVAVVSGSNVIAKDFKSVSDIKKEYSGKVVKFTNSSGNPMSFTYNPDGSVDGAVNSSTRVYTDSGRWRVPETGKLCRQMSRWSEGSEVCYNVFKEDAQSIHEKAGLRPLSEEELKTLMVDHTLYGRAKFHSRWTDGRVSALYIHPDGRYWASCCEHNDWKRSFQGKWWIKDGQFCNQNVYRSEPRCYKYYRDGKALVTEKREYYRIEKGDKFK